MEASDGVSKLLGAAAKPQKDPGCRALPAACRDWEKGIQGRKGAP